MEKPSCQYCLYCRICRHNQQIVRETAKDAIYKDGRIRNCPCVAISADMEKRPRKAASIQDPFNSLLAADEEGSRGSHDFRRHGLQILFPHEPKWDPVPEFRVQAGEPGLDHSGIFSFGEHPDELEGKPQTLFSIAVKLTSVYPPIDGAHIPDTADVGGELAADKADELLDDLRDGEAKRFPMGCEIRSRRGNGCHGSSGKTEYTSISHVKLV
jgi:hypothetical protein